MPRASKAKACGCYVSDGGPCLGHEIAPAVKARKPKAQREQQASWWETPLTPNFIRAKDDGGSVPIHFLADADLRAIAAAWTEELLAKAAKRREGRVKVGGGRG